ncbi:hypothetical protein MUK42_15050 [Musa troglodytarum]|uniref:FLZ-type domain-containing protein n=1 Tax=Musa troglodytarum TaxID=320322 RepID=A0A9E7L9Y4_9LILI|nr:hypothetical protein MUK42_15050 [Musa troglodytarum]
MVHQPRPIIGKLPDAIFLGDRMWFAGAIPSPTTPSERNSLYPRRWKNGDSGGVGLGIAVALEKAGGESPRKLHATTLPIAIGSPRTSRPQVCPGGRHWERGQGGCCASPPPVANEESQVADFLSNCFLCGKRLHGMDIFMYREKAFCSVECRHQQMVSDDYQEKCGVEASKPSGSPYSGGQLFFTAIVVS